MNVTGRRTRQEIQSSVYPTGQSLVHATIYGGIAACAYVAGFHHIAQIVSVMAVAVIASGSISRASKAIADGIGRLWVYLRGSVAFEVLVGMVFLLVVYAFRLDERNSDPAENCKEDEQ